MDKGVTELDEQDQAVVGYIEAEKDWNAAEDDLFAAIEGERQAGTARRRAWDRLLRSVGGNLMLAQALIVAYESEQQERSNAE